MPLNTMRSALVAAVVAGVVYFGAFGHQWASDDVSIIQNNPAAHSPAAAIGAWFEPYWPADITLSGQYRPLTILAFAVDWSLFGDQPGRFHIVNALWHALATLLFCLVVARWVPPAGVLVAGLVFAVHPVHVEAVANVVGRAELMVAAGLFGAILLARRYRARPDAGRLSAVLAVLALSLFVKEHAVVAVALLALDEWLCDGRLARRSAALYVGTVVVTLSWLVLFQAIAADYVDLAVAATIRDLTLLERLATMLPAQLEVVRLLTFPFALAADYNPLVIPRRVDWSAVATIGLLTTAAVVALGLMSSRKAPAVSFGILAGIISYSPTSNILFPSGIMLAERNLYIAVAAPALVLAWLVTRNGINHRRATLIVAAVCVIFAGRTVQRIPFWRDGETVLIEDYAQHPENYRNHLRVGGFLRRNGNLPAALAQTLVAGTIFPDDPWVVQYVMVRAVDLGALGIAMREARRAYAADSTHPSFARLMVRAHLARGEFDHALPVAARSLRDAPASLLAAESYSQVLDSLGIGSWLRTLAEAREHFIKDELIAATDSLDRVAAVLSDAAGPCAELAPQADIVADLMRNPLPCGPGQ